MINQGTKAARLQTISCFSHNDEDVKCREKCEHHTNAV